MAKTVTIPKCRNPFEVTINNKSYSYTAGEIVEVPNEVAEVIEWHEDVHKSMTAPPYESSSSGGKNYLPSYIDGSLTEITMEMLEGATKIGWYMFAHSKIESIEIPESVTSLEKYCFYNCNVLKRINIPNGVTELPQEAFVNGKALTSFVIPDSVKSIGTSVFANCTSLAKFYLPEVPPTLENVNAFSNINSACVFYCKNQESLNAYKADTKWSALTVTYTFAVEN